MNSSIQCPFTFAEWSDSFTESIILRISIKDEESGTGAELEAKNITVDKLNHMISELEEIRDGLLEEQTYTS